MNVAVLIGLLAGTVLFAWLFRKPIHRVPWVFYLIAIALDLLLFLNSATTLPLWLVKVISVLMQRGGLGVAFFILVMWIGVFPRNGKVSKVFRPIRGELSIIACILIAGHMAQYMSTYLPLIISGSAVKTTVMGAFVIACVLLALILVLGFTSFRFVKRHMKAKTWKKLQTLAYVFYVLVLVHLYLMIMPSAISGNARSIAVVAFYGVVFGGYFVARIVRAVVDHREKVDLAKTVMDQGFRE